VKAVEEADVLIVVGTSGVVFRAAGVIDQARNRGARIIVVNAEPISSVVDITIIGSAGSIMPELLAG
jgi:NAD-dependent deacetylase